MTKTKKTLNKIKKEKEGQMTFDVYFSMLCGSNNKIKNYHKKAMELFFKNRVGLIATKEEFDEVFKQY